jgi:hypothetical protein
MQKSKKMIRYAKEEKHYFSKAEKLNIDSWKSDMEELLLQLLPLLNDARKHLREG